MNIDENDDELADTYCWHKKPIGPGPYCTGCGGLIKDNVMRKTNQITYKEVKEINVYLDGKQMGKIKPINKGYAYFPTGCGPNGHGRIYESIDLVKTSIEKD